VSGTDVESVAAMAYSSLLGYAEVTRMSPLVDAYDLAKTL
jgi:hypothetical protein